MPSQDYDIFISYSNADQRFVRDLTSALRRRGLRVLFDEGSIRVGDDFSTSITDALEHSRNFLVVISPDFMASPWTNFELGVAIGRRLSDSKAKLLPLFIGDVAKSSLPPFLAKRHGLNVENLPVDAVASRVEQVVREEQPA